MLPLWGINTAVDKEVCAVKAEWQALYGAKVLCAMCCVQVACRRCAYGDAIRMETLCVWRRCAYGDAICMVWSLCLRSAGHMERGVYGGLSLECCAVSMKRRAIL